MVRARTDYRSGSIDIAAGPGSLCCLFARKAQAWSNLDAAVQELILAGVLQFAINIGMAILMTFRP